MLIENILPWAQLVAMVVAAIVAIQKIRSTTELLAQEIRHLAAALERLDQQMDRLVGTIHSHETRLAVLEKR